MGKPRVILPNRSKNKTTILLDTQLLLFLNGASSRLKKSIGDLIPYYMATSPKFIDDFTSFEVLGEIDKDLSKDGEFNFLTKKDGDINGCIREGK